MALALGGGKISPMKKVLLVSQRYSIFTEPLIRAFRQLGWEVRFIDYLGTPLLMTNTLTQRIFDKLPSIIRGPLRRRELKKIDANILRVAREYSPDLIFVSKGKNLGHEMLDELRKKHLVANWYPETMDHWGRISSIAPHYTYFFNFDPTVVGELKKSGHQNAHYLPFCADLSKNAAYPELERQSPVSFVGSFEPTRYANREKILAPLTGLGFNLWGNKAWLKTGLRKFYRGYPSNSEMMDIYKKSKIVVGMHVSGVPGTGVNVRPFEVTSSGALLINQDERKDIFNLFRVGEEFVTFHNEHDLKEKVKYYLAHDGERNKIARAGFQKTRSQHTYSDRLDKMLKVMDLSQ